MSSASGVLRDRDDPESVVSYLSASEAEALVEEGVVAAGMIPKVRSLVEAVRGGVGRTHILSGLGGHALLTELFTKEGSGTMITLEEERERYLQE